MSNEEQDLLTQFQEAVNDAKRLGTEHGQNAADCWFNYPEATYEENVSVFKQFEDGDPAILDTLPSHPLSGEFGDSITPAYLMNEVGLISDPQDWRAGEVQEWICNAYEEAFHDSVHNSVVARLRRAIAQRWSFSIIAELVSEDAEELLGKMEEILNERGIDIQHSSCEREED